MSVYPTDGRFGHLAMHLLHAVVERLGTVNIGQGVRLGHDLGKLADAYIREGAGDRTTYWITGDEPRDVSPE